MIPWKSFVACPDAEIDEGLRIALNSLGQWAERKRISLYAGHNGAIDLHFRLKSAIMMALDEATEPPPPDDRRRRADNPSDEQATQPPAGDAPRRRGRPRKAAKTEISFNGQTYVLGKSNEQK